MPSSASIEAGRAHVRIGLQNRIKEDSRGVTAALSAIGAQAQAIGDKMKRISLVPAIGAAGGFAAAAAGPIKFAASIEDATASFKTLTQSSADAKRAIEIIGDVSKSTPFEFAGLAQASRSILVATGDINSLERQLRNISDVAAATQTPVEELGEVFGKMANGKITLEDLNRFATRGIPIFEALNEALGKPFDTSNSQELVENLRLLSLQGRVTFRDIDQAFQVLAQGRFFGAADEASRTLTGRLSTLADEIKFALLPAGVKLAEKLKEIVIYITPIVSSIGQWVESNKEIITSLVTVGGSLTALTVGGAALIKGLGFIISAYGGLATALGKMVAGGNAEAQTLSRQTAATQAATVAEIGIEKAYAHTLTTLQKLILAENALTDARKGRGGLGGLGGLGVRIQMDQLLQRRRAIR